MKNLRWPHKISFFHYFDKVTDSEIDVNFQPMFKIKLRRFARRWKACRANTNTPVKRSILPVLCLLLFAFSAFARAAAPRPQTGGQPFALRHASSGAYPDAPRKAETQTETTTFYVSALENKEKVKAVETQLYAVKGVTEVTCNLLTRTVRITYRAGQTSKTRLASAFRKIGLEALAVDNGAGCPVPPAGRRL